MVNNLTALMPNSERPGYFLKTLTYKLISIIIQKTDGSWYGHDRRFDEPV